MHRYNEETDELARAVVDYAMRRVAMEPPPLDHPMEPEELLALAGQTVTPEGLGGTEALRLFAEVLAPATISIDHPRYLSFIPAAPTEASILFDLVVGASSIYGGSWLEAAGAVFAENQALRWIADLAGLPPEAGGVFVQGGTNGNLSSLVAARHSARERRGSEPRRWHVAASSEAHSSVPMAARVMDVDVLRVPVGPDRKLTGAALAAALDAHAGDDVFAVVASAGSTNLGIVDDLASVSRVASERGIWLHVDGAYGGAALAAPSVRSLFDGVERADSFIVDPHKWLFAPFDCCALLYRDPQAARRAHTQQGEYLEALQVDARWDPSDFAVQLSRRARGLPFWFSLATYGTNAYTEAIERTLAVARAAAAEIRSRPYLELVNEPELTVVPFKRLSWSTSDYATWSARLLREQTAFVIGTSVDGEPATRFAIVNPRTTVDDIRLILDSMA